MGTRVLLDKSSEPELFEASARTDEVSFDTLVTSRLSVLVSPANWKRFDWVLF